MKRYAEYEQFNPFRRPDWRWQRVESIANRLPVPGRCSAHDDGWIRKARNFLCRWRRADDDEREQIIWECPGLVYAYQIHERRTTVPATAQFLEARLLAGQAAEVIAEEISTLPDTVRWFEALFFNVANHLHRRDWIMSMVLLPPIMQHLGLNTDGVLGDGDPETPAQRRRRLDEVVPVAQPFLDGSLKYFAYFGGPIVADLMIHGVASRKPASQDDLPRWLNETSSLAIKRRSLQTALHSELNKFNAMDLLTVHARFIEIERGEDSQESQRSTVERHIRTMLDDLPWRAGPRPDVRDPAIDKYHGCPGELRDDELLSDVPVPVAELSRALPPPRTRQSQPPTTDSQSDIV